MFKLSDLTITVSIVKQGIFPLDKQWRVDERGYSRALSYQLVWLSALVPFAEVQQILQEVGQLSLGTTTIWELSQVHGGEGWKELKVAVVSGLEQDWTGEEAQVRLIDMDYRAVIGSVTDFEDYLWALAVKHGVPYAGQIIVVADGATWIWRLVNDLFPVCTQILDYYHAKQHLAQAAQACYPDDDAASQSWFQQMTECLFQGEIWKIIASLENHGQAASYFVNQQRRMQYQQFQADGYPIGSEAVESAIKQFKHRLSGAGMRWSRAGADRMVTIRAAVMSGSLQDLWQQAA